MITICSQEKFEQAKKYDEIELKCKTCQNVFLKKKVFVLYAIENKNGKRKGNDTCEYCSQKCLWKAFSTKRSVNCKECNKEFLKHLSQIKIYPNHFCCVKCSSSFYRKTKTGETKRSKLEVWLENKLKIHFPTIEFLFNDRVTIEAELDILLPELNLAFELNGIFHYEPIFGEETLNKTQNRDKNKMIICYKKNIELCVIDTTKMGKFKDENCMKYFDIISKIITDKLEREKESSN